MDKIILWKLKIKEESFYKKGELEAIYYYNSEGELDGEGKIFYKSGKIRKLINYSNGKKNNCIL